MPVIMQNPFRELALVKRIELRHVSMWKPQIREDVREYFHKHPHLQHGDNNSDAIGALFNDFLKWINTTNKAISYNFHKVV